MPDLTQATDLHRLLGDGTRLRLLALVGEEALSVAEIVRVTGLTQSRVSTHLGRLREAGLVCDRAVSGSTRYALADPLPEAAAAWWRVTRAALDDPLLQQDVDRARQEVAQRSGGSTWADTVAGRMSRHYSPGRTWASFARGAAGLIGLGPEARVLDIASGDGALAELIAPQVAEVVCLDASAAVVASGQKRLAPLGNVRFQKGDMHRLPCPDAAFDGAILMGALCYAHDPAQVLREAARVLKPGGRLTASTLAAHSHTAAVAPFDHVQMGFTPDALAADLKAAGFEIALCAPTQRERRPPRFEVITVHARRGAS